MAEVAEEEAEAAERDLEGGEDEEMVIVPEALFRELEEAPLLASR